MANCINKNSKAFKDLRRETNLSIALLATKISLWQTKNNSTEFPTQEQIFATMPISKRIGISSKEVSTLEKNLINGKVKIYNTLKNIQRIFVEFTPVGQADLHTWAIKKLDKVEEQKTPEVKKNTEEQQSLMFQTNNSVQYILKAVDILQSDKAKQIFEKGKKAGWDLNKILTELQIPKEQKQLLLDLGNRPRIKTKPGMNPWDDNANYNKDWTREELILELSTQMSFAIEINTAKDEKVQEFRERNKDFTFNDVVYLEGDGEYGKRVNGKFEEITFEEYKIAKKQFEKSLEGKPTQYYSNLTVPGGTNYTENEIATPLITPSIKGHAQFATDNGIGWFRSDKQIKTENNNNLNVRNSIVKAYKEKTIIELPISLIERLAEFDRATNPNRIVPAQLGEKDKLNPFNNIKEMTSRENIDRIKESIIKNGFNGYLEISLNSKGAVALTEGNHRLQALKELGYKNIPVKVLGRNTVVGEYFEMVENGKTRKYGLNLNKDFNDGNIKTRRILEVQSDLFQKGRDKKDLVFINTIPNIINDFEYDLEIFKTDNRGNYSKLLADPFGTENEITISENEYKKAYKNVFNKEFKKFEVNYQLKENQFLQLLNKDNNWVTFFIKSIIQDSAKKGYEKVLFPTGNTASKVEGHTTLEEFKKQKKDRIKELENPKGLVEKYSDLDERSQYNISEEQWNKNRKELLEKNTNEINQLKQELERVEKEGFGALKPIWNFYENTVTNILKKNFPITQITDEYGNTWNEVTIEKERDNNNILLQKSQSTLQQSIASKETIEKLKEIIAKLGINLVVLEKYLKDNPNVRQDINGLADLVKGTIAIATGKESETLTEELVHIATAIVEQKNPKLITDLISKIDKFKIYKKVLAQYKDVYKTSDGKPDIRKIKKEAVDKLIAELVINKAQGTEQFPELLELENKNLVEQMWDAITSFIKQLYNGKQVDIFTPFEKIAEDILNNNINGSVQNLKNTENNVMYQIDKNSPVEKVAEKLRYMHNNIVAPSKLVSGEDRYYTYLGKKMKYTVTTFLEKKGLIRTEAETIVDNQKKEWGSEGHEYIYNYISSNLIDENGYMLNTPKNIAITTKLKPAVKEKIESFCKELIGSYAKGTVFLVETNVVNEKVEGKEGMGSAIDFVAIEPVKITKKDGTIVDDVKVDILDWKFTTVNDSEDLESDIILSKQLDWKAQMGQYSKIMYKIGINSSQLRKTRMLPFIANYSYQTKKDKSSPLVMTSIEIGNLDTMKETALYLLPTTLISESTNNQALDEYIESLNAYYINESKKSTELENKFAKESKLKQLSAALKKLQLQYNFEPLYNVAKTYLIDVRNTLDVYKNADFNKLNRLQLQELLKSLIDFKKSSDKFLGIDDVYATHINIKNPTKEEKKLLNSFREISKSTKIANNEMLKLQKRFAEFDNANEGFLNNILAEEKDAGKLDENFTEGSKMPVAIRKLISRKNLLRASKATLDFNVLADEFGKKIKAFANNNGSDMSKLFTLIGKKTDTDLQLFQKTSQEFLDIIDNALVKRDKKTLLDNVNVEALTKDIDVYVQKGIKNIENTQHSSDAQENQEQIDKRKKALINRMNINSKNFNGFDNYDFKKYYKKHMFSDKNHSEEYKNLLNNKEALAVWEFFTMLNQRASDVGLINQQGLSFFPLIEATFVQKLENDNNFFSETGDFFKDLITSDVNEDIAFGKIDEETGEQKLTIPKFFTRSNKEVNKLSTNILQVGLAWTKTLLEYESRKDMEYELLTLLEVQESKKSIVTDNNGNIIFKNNKNEARLKKGNQNIKEATADVNEMLYGISENSDSLGNSALKGAARISGAEDVETSTISIKKTLTNVESYQRLLALGLKVTLGVANTFGFASNSFINSGTHYSGSEIAKYMGKVMLPFLGNTTLETKALLNYIIPFNGQNALKMKERQIGKGISLKSYLSSFNFSEVIMLTNSFGEHRIEMANALAMIDNTMVINGKLINIRKFVKKQDQIAKKGMIESERLALEKTFETRVKDFQKSDKALNKIIKFENDNFEIPGVSTEELSKFRVKVIDVSRAASGQMSNEDKMGHRRDTLARSFMNYKTWIPKLLQTRFRNLAYDSSTDEWEYGRYKAFSSAIKAVTFRNITDLRDIIKGTDKGLAIIDKMLEVKKEQHFINTGQKLEITAEDYHDLIRQQVVNGFKEISLLLSSLSLFLACALAEPDDDENKQTKNIYKYFAKIVHKINTELSFFINPMSADEVTKGSLIPALGILTKIWRVVSSVTKETYYVATGNEKEADKIYPIKYTADLFIGVHQAMRNVLPYIYPETASEYGIEVQIETKR